ncbi:MAG TPA: cobalamin B12-binding domain-containing protein [Candidatus Nitrosocosmicus sp.]|nr:cobalamin B12-binding domain-containing protein [Candidatus Nitrosocosmicus sp.]
MVFIRVKKVKGFDYYYLVKSQWDSKRKISMQHTIKYLGKAADVTIDSIPPEYKNDPKILSLLATATQEHKNKVVVTAALKKRVFDALKNGDIEKIVDIAGKYKEQASVAEFYEDILRPVLYDVGYFWQENKLDIGMEHVCSNTANKTIHKITGSIKPDDRMGKIIICTPYGELHNIACNIIESVLFEKGFQVNNVSPSIPTDSMINYIDETKPCMILISVTLKDNIGSTVRLVKKISNIYSVPILVGGLAINHCSDIERKNIEEISPYVKIIVNAPLNTIVKTIKGIAKGNNPRNIKNFEQELVV